MMTRRGANWVRELISYLIGAVVSESRSRLQAAKPNSVDRCPQPCEVLIAFLPAAAQSRS